MSRLTGSAFRAGGMVSVAPDSLGHLVDRVKMPVTAVNNEDEHAMTGDYRSQRRRSADSPGAQRRVRNERPTIALRLRRQGRAAWHRVRPTGVRPSRIAPEAVF